MNDKKRKARLSLIFAAAVFAIMLVALLLVLAGEFILEHFGLMPIDLNGRVPLLYFAAVSLIVGSVLAYAFSEKPLKPIRKIIDATDRIAAGDYSVRLEENDRLKEFRELNGKFNHMAAELGSIEMLRSDFIRNFSHEFKTPIVSIRGFARALKWDNLSEEMKQEYLDIIIDESERLSALSANILYLSSIENQSIITDKKHFNVTEQLRLVVVLLDKKLESKSLNIEFEGNEVFVTGNEEMMKQVWINLLDNAIKYSPANGTIGIRIRDTGNGASVSISDEGPGIPFEIKDRIFDKFYQGDSSHKEEGNGLGLAIVKKIVDLHGGNISVKTSDKGSVFSVTVINA